MATISDDPASLKRLGGGRWQTRDDRFTVEPLSGAWVVVDAEHVDDLGLPLVRGPFRSLRDAKAAIAQAREAGPAASALSERVEASRRRPKPSPLLSVRTAEAASTEPIEAAEPPEPRWLTELDPDRRRRARRLIDRLLAAGVTDAEGMARRDVAGNVAAVAEYAVARAVRDLAADAPPEAVARLLADGRDEALEVGWRLTDLEGRPISLDVGAE